MVVVVVTRDFSLLFSFEFCFAYFFMTHVVMPNGSFKIIRVTAVLFI